MIRSSLFTKVLINLLFYIMWTIPVLAANGLYYYGEYFYLDSDTTAVLIAPVSNSDPTFKHEYKGDFEVWDWIPFGNKAHKVIAVANETFVSQNITSFKLGQYVKRLGKLCCYNVKTLTRLEMNDALQTIGKESFYNCTALSEITLSSELRNIGERAFARTSIVGELNFPPTLDSIQSAAFFGTNVRKISFCSPKLFVGSLAFHQCNKLDTISVSDLNNWCKYKFEDETYHPLKYCTLTENGAVISEVNLSQEIDSVPFGAFMNIKTLLTVSLGTEIKYIAPEAFYSPNLETFICKAVSPPEVYDNSFHSYNFSHCKLIVPSESVEIYRAHPIWGKFATIEELPSISTGVLEIFADKNSMEFTFNDHTIIPLNNSFIRVCDITGKRIYFGKQPIDLPPSLYIVNKTKILIR